MKIVLFVFIAVLAAFSAHAQYGFTNIKEVEGLKNRQLVVVLLDENPADPENQAKETNELLLKTLAANWTFSNPPIVKSAAEGKIIKNSKDKTVALIGVQHMKDDVSRTTSSTNTTIENKFNQGMAGRPGTMDRNFVNKTTFTVQRKNVMTPALVLEFPEKEQYVYRFELPADYPSEAHLITAVTDCQNYFTSWITDKAEPTLSARSQANGSLLLNKILLVDKADLAEKISEDDIKKNYPLPYQIVSTEVLEQAIVSKDPRYAFVVMVKPPSFHEIIYNHYVYDCEKSRFMGYTFGKENKIEAKHFKYYYKFSQKKPKG